MNVDINYLAVFIAAASTMILGFIWYGPLFGKQWAKMMGMDTKEKMAKVKKEAPKLYGISFVLALLTAYVLAHVLSFANAHTISDGAQGAFWAWLGFVMPVQATNAMFNNKSFKLFSIDTGYQLVCFLVMGAILAVWR